MTFSIESKRWDVSVFVRKINNNFVFGSLITVTSCLMLLSPASIKAHEMWIEPVNYSVKLGDKILANEIVGQGFKGNKYAYLDSSFDKLDITVRNRTQEIKSRLGDLPAVQEDTSEEGLHIITAETPYSELVYETAEKFANFLNEDGLEWVFAAHKKRGLPEKGFTEIYRRNPKALVKVGHGKGQDKALGLSLEWVAETNPYTSQGNIKAQLLWQGVPAANMHVNVFNRLKRTSDKSELIKTSLRTDDNGRVEIPRAKGGIFLINSVKMIQPDAKVGMETEAVWESIWGSLTYEILLGN